VMLPVALARPFESVHRGESRIPGFVPNES
jgi:hypothetical protein